MTSFRRGVAMAAAVATCASLAATYGVASAAPDDEWLWAEPVDLGTLGGTDAMAEAIDGDLVVGSAQTETGAWHAYVVDLADASPQMVDLGTLGGRHSRATDVSGSVLVGTSKMERRRDGYHLFALDLDDPDTGMIDLGPMGGSEIGDPGPFVDDGLVAGQIRSRGPNARTVAFTYDLHAAEPRVVRHGTFGGWDSAVFGVRDGVAVGFADVPGDEARAFVLHPRQPDPELEPLGPADVGGSALDVDDGLVVGRYWARAGSKPFAVDLGDPHRTFQRLPGGVGSATAVDGRTAVGSSAVSGTVHPAAFDLTSGISSVTDLGTLGGWGTAIDIDGTTVVGYTYTPAGGLHSFADDLSDDDALTDLGVLDGGTSAWATDVDDGVVVGRGSTGAGTRAVAWRLGRTTEPRVRFSALDSLVDESAGVTTVTVERSGSTAGAAAVQVLVLHSGYRGGKPGKDFGPVPTEVTFAPGQTAASFNVPILQDGRTEPRERIGFQLADPQGALLGAGQVTAVRIRASDVRPDLLVQRPDDASVLGDDVFSDNPEDQTRTWSVRPGGSRTFFVEVCNDPRDRRNDDFQAPLVLHADGARTTWVRGRRDVTEAITSTAGLSLRVYTGRCKRVRVTTQAGVDAPVGSLLPSTLRADWAGENPATDVVGTAVRVGGPRR